MEEPVYRRMAELEQRHWWFRGRRRVLSSLLSRLPLPPAAQILEVGSGTGGNLGMLGQLGQVQALEPDTQARALCREHYAIDPQSGLLPGPLPFAARHFDLIAALDVLEHVQADNATLRALHQHLKPGGYLLLTVPAFPFLWSAHDLSHHHKRRYRRQNLVRQLEDAGFKVSYASYFNSWLFPLIAGVRLIKPLLRRDATPDDRLPRAWLNRLLEGIFASERHLLRHLSLPFGVSLVVIAERPDAPQ